MDPYDPKRNSSFPNLKKDNEQTQAHDNEFKEPLDPQAYNVPPAIPPYANYNDYPVNDPYALPPGQKWPNSKLGIASFIIGLSTIVISIIVAVVATIMISSAIGDSGDVTNMWNEQNIEATMASMLGGIIVLITIWGFVILANLTGLVLGIIGCCAKQRRRIFAVIGVVLNSLPAVFFIFSIVLGIFSGSSY